MNIQPQQPISDDQELAKVLAGITANADQTTAVNPSAQVPTLAEDADVAGNPEADIVAPAPVIAPLPSPAPAVVSPTPVSNLEAIKSDALNELRPLVDKLNVSPQEKFDTYLLLIRSTDDTTLISPAFEAARGITDEAAKAQALLDVVKEIDYLSHPQQAA